jgi:hypothetical protein
MRVATASGSGRFATKEGKNRRENRRQPCNKGNETRAAREKGSGRPDRSFLGGKGRMSDENTFGIALQVAVEQAVHGPVLE